MLIERQCRLQSSALYESKSQMVFILHVPARLDARHLESDMRAKFQCKTDDLLPAKRRVGEEKDSAPLARRQQPVGHEAAAFDVLVL